MGKYDALGSFLRRWARKNGGDGVDLNFDQIEGIIRAALPNAANTVDWWRNDHGAIQSRSWLEAGFEAQPIPGRDRVHFQRLGVRETGRQNSHALGNKRL